MVTLPPEFAAIRFPGYFYNTSEGCLYSLKVTGVLRPLRRVYPCRFNRINESGYYLSVNGKRRFIGDSQIQKNHKTVATIPVA